MARARMGSPRALMVNLPNNTSVKKYRKFIKEPTQTSEL